MHRDIQQLQLSDKFVIALFSGLAVTGGFALALNYDLRIACL
jgi:enoyl-CoA hydratase/carnithine racemase